MAGLPDVSSTSSETCPFLARGPKRMPSRECETGVLLPLPFPPFFFFREPWRDAAASEDTLCSLLWKLN